jgi:multicomponent Na+:H+ antiporter subunit D
MNGSLPPGLVFLLAAALAALVGPRLRVALLVAAPLATGALLLAWPGLGTAEAAAVRLSLAGFDLLPCRLDGLAAIFSGLFCVAALLCGVFSLHVSSRGQVVSALVYAGCAIGAVGAGDYLSLFVCVEGMAVASTFLIWARGGERALRAGWRYLLWQLVSGLLLLAGAVLVASSTGSLAVVPPPSGDPAALLLLFAFGIKACFPGLHVWLTDAYPEATATGTVWLSCFTTKVGVCLLARLFAGHEALVYVGVTMACFPIFYAVIENDLRRVLAYSLVNQIGFMVCGIGLGSDVAMAGAVAHACNDVVFKGLLFMSMGSVLQQTGRIGGNELGGLWRTMPRTTAFCIVGAASISAFPLFSGFVSKSMVMTAALAQGHDVVWLLLLFASAGVFHHAGIKIPFFAFFAHDAGLRAGDPPRNMQLAMALGAVLCIGVGCAPGLLYGLLPYSFDYQPYDATHVLAQLQLLFWSALAFAWLQRTGLYPPELASTNLDADWLLRRAGSTALERLRAALGALTAGLERVAASVFERAWAALIRRRGPRGPFARSAPTESMMLWTAVLLAVLLVLYLL